MILALSGPKGGGKDTIGEGLAKLFEADVDRFARKLYAMGAAFDPVIHPKMSHEDKEDWLLGDPELGTRRNFLEKLGTEFGREIIHPLLWVNAAIRDAYRLPTVLVDCRFENESKAVRDVGGVVIHLRPDWTDFGRQHKSDHPLTVYPGDIVFRLTNGNYEDDLERLATLVANQLKGDAR